METHDKKASASTVSVRDGVCEKQDQEHVNLNKQKTAGATSQQVEQKHQQQTQQLQQRQQPASREPGRR